MLNVPFEFIAVLNFGKRRSFETSPEWINYNTRIREVSNFIGISPFDGIPRRLVEQIAVAKCDECSHLLLSRSLPGLTSTFCVLYTPTHNKPSVEVLLCPKVTEAQSHANRDHQG